jgi:hypothetical protein
MFKTLFSKIEKIICFYLGLENEEPRPHKIRRAGKQLWVKHTSPFKRHAMNSPWEELSVEEAQTMETMGEQMGKALGKELIVTFKEPKIRMNRHA